MLIRRSVWLLLLACASAALAAPLPVRWGLDLLAGEAGWRFRQEFAVWPGLYWRGPDRPPVAARPDDPNTWGVLRLGPRPDVPPAISGGLTDLTAPLTDSRPVVDGVLGSDEWAAAVQTVEELDEGDEWALYAQHTPDTLYVCLACPSALGVRKGQVAELYLTPADADDRPAAAPPRALRLRADRDQRPDVQSLELHGSRWDELPTPKDSPAPWRGGASGRGDGAWSFAVYEWAVPLAYFAAEGQPLPERFRFLARLQSPAHAAGGDIRNTDPEEIIWPDGRSTWTAPARQRSPLGPRPDAWQALQLGGGDPGDALSVPATTRAIKPDGQIGIKEWADAYQACYSLPCDQWRRLWLARDDKHLYVAVRVRLARGLRLEESCRLFVDPVGDGGLQPRGDDLQYRLPLGLDTSVEALRVAGADWSPAESTDVKAACYPVSAYESTYEWSLPLSALGPDQRPHLAVEVVYGLPK